MGPSGSWRNLASGQCFRRHDNLSHLQQKLFIPMNQIESLFSLVMVSILFAIQHDTQEDGAARFSVLESTDVYSMGYACWRNQCAGAEGGTCNLPV